MVRYFASREFIISWALLALLTLTAQAADRPAAIDKLSFRTETGKTVAWKDLAGDKGTVAVFLSFDCPMSTDYCKPLSDLASRLYRADKAFFYSNLVVEEVTAGEQNQGAGDA